MATLRLKAAKSRAKRARLVWPLRFGATDGAVITVHSVRSQILFRVVHPRLF